MLAAGTIVMLLLAVFIVMFVVMYQKKMIKKQAEYQLGLLEVNIQAQENERKRIARDLHDDVGTLLSTVKLKIGQISQNAKRSHPLPSNFEREAKLLIDETIANTGRISRDLLPATLEEFGLVDALKELCDRINTSSNITVHFLHEGNGRRLKKKIELALYRMVQELVNNSVKHAEADKINVALKVESGQLEMIVNDNGKGFDFQKVKQRPPEKRGLGLRNMESRISVLNGKIMYESALGSGTKVTINVEV